MQNNIQQKPKKLSKKITKKKLAPLRLWLKAKFMGFRRSRVQQNQHQALVKIQGLDNRKDAWYYFGKRICYIYKAHKKIHKTKFRSIWGRIVKAHGNSGLCIARFQKNLPPRAMGATLRIMLYPQRFSFV